MATSREWEQKACQALEQCRSIVGDLWRVQSLKKLHADSNNEYERFRIEQQLTNLDESKLRKLLGDTRREAVDCWIEALNAAADPADPTIDIVDSQ